MTSSQESSEDRPKAPGSMGFAGIESLGGVFHPHAIEVQEFSTYGLLVDVRPQAEFDEDHVPGAVRLDPIAVDASPSGTTSAPTPGAEPTVLPAQDSAAIGDVPAALRTHLASVGRDQGVLVYCGRGGRDSLPVARALRWRGWTVDVLPGGWINYRRWVQAGLAQLPRLMSLRVVATALGCEGQRVLQALAAAGHQVVDVQGLACWRPEALTPKSPPQPFQAWFESQLLQQLRQLNGQRPVWVNAIERSMGNVELPAALADAIEAAPTAQVEASLEDRLACWQAAESAWNESVEAICQRLDPRTLGASLLTRLKSTAVPNAEAVMRMLVQDHFEPALQARLAATLARSNALPPLAVSSYEAAALADALRTWPAAAEH